MSSDQVIFLGSLSSFQQDQSAYSVWILEHFFTSFVNYQNETNTDLSKSFGNFLYKKNDFMSWTQLKTESEMHSKEKAMYENPLLEEDDITI